MGGYGDSLVARGFSLKNDMAAGLMDSNVSPMPAKHIRQGIAA